LNREPIWDSAWPTSRGTKTAPCNGLLASQYKAVLPLLGYYQFMDKFFTPGYLLDIVAARK
jgi:hypothetical protein